MVFFYYIPFWEFGNSQLYRNENNGQSRLSDARDQAVARLQNIPFSKVSILKNIKAFFKNLCDLASLR